MKITKQTSQKNTKLIVAIVTGLFLAAGGGLYYTETHHLTNLIKNPFAPSATDEAKQKEQATKNDPTTSPATAKESAQPADGVNSSQTTDQVPVSPTTTIAITNLDQANHIVNVATKITDAAASGTCTITFSSTGARPVTRTIQTTNDTCATAIPDQEFSLLGDWKVTINYFANNTQATTTGTITIK